MTNPTTGCAAKLLPPAGMYQLNAALKRIRNAANRLEKVGIVCGSLDKALEQLTTARDGNVTWNTRPQPAPQADEPEFLLRAYEHRESFVPYETFNQEQAEAQSLSVFGERMYRLGQISRLKVEDAEVKDTARWLRSFGDTGSAPLFDRAADLLERLIAEVKDLRASGITAAIKEREIE